MTERELEAEIDKAFSSGAVWDADEKKLRAFMQLLSFQGIPNDYVRHRQIVRALAINYILTSRFIARINRQNTYYGIAVGVVALLSMIASILQCFAAFLALRR